MPADYDPASVTRADWPCLAPSAHTVGPRCFQALYFPRTKRPHLGKNAKRAHPKRDVMIAPDALDSGSSSSFNSLG